MSMVRLDKVNLSIGEQLLFDDLQLQIEPGERVCLLGRNGEGKSTLLRVLAGDGVVDEGQIWRKPGIRITTLEQELPAGVSTSVYDFIAEGDERAGRLLAQYHDVIVELETSADDEMLKRLGNLQKALESNDGWSLKQRVESVISRLQLPAEAPLSELSGGWQRRVALGRALVADPDLLLLDEPTNHMDVEAIEWLEDWLQDFRGAVLFITHDRALLQRLATRILELDRGQLTSWPGDYANYLRRREERLHAEEQENREFDKKLAQEEVWIRQGIKARRTRNEGRVRALKALREERAARRSQLGNARLDLDSGSSSGKLVAEAESVSKSFGDNTVIRNFSGKIMRGDRVGLIGPNGCGKSTLLRLLLGELDPDQGKLRQGTNLEIAYFDQQRARLDPEKTVIDNVADGREQIQVGKKTKHIISYLSDFLFSPDRARGPVSALSGGEKNRVLLARIFSQPANLLVLDEPTNDLDIETLELLEDLLINYPGTLLLVSHDRAFVDNVVTSCLAFEGDGKITEVVGGYAEWTRQRRSQTAKTKTPKITKSTPESVPAKPANKKLSYKEQRELTELPKKIEVLEAEHATLTEAVGQSDFYRQDSEQIATTLDRIKELESELEIVFARWEALESGG